MATNQLHCVPRTLLQQPANGTPRLEREGQPRERSVALELGPAITVGLVISSLSLQENEDAALIAPAAMELENHNRELRMPVVILTSADESG